MFYDVKTVTIRRRQDAKPPAADEYLRFFNKKTCNFSHFLRKIYLCLSQKYLRHVIETWILVIWLMHPACSTMVNTLATTSTTDHRQSDTIKTALYAKSFNFVDHTMVKGW